uniref:Uncharacterized protein n=2 Tax=unclassified Streptomyces TaxID=2593676 RepID=V9Z5V9_9ACTN|nr:MULTISPECIES: hypothetical protein [unclassified Streptomyces]AHE39010.1 Hypothetical protein pFRL3_233c [Streptomyces sp. FR1]AHE39508.1 Hypothetical protein pFRL4_275c [Streptomyces sp. F2]
MSSRADAKAAARRTRLEAERARQAARQRRIRLAAAAAVVLASAGAVIGGIRLAGTSGTGNTGSSGTTALGRTGPAVNIAALPGLQTSKAAWQPEYTHLPARLADLHLPPNGDESYHIHAHLALYVGGKQVPVPANVGISMADQIESPMHTHDTSGVIHIEASQASNAFTLGAFLDIWGVKLTDHQLGGYTATGGSTLQAYANGKPLTDPARYVLHPHDNIVLGYGTQGSVPHTVAFTWPAGE